MFPCFISLMKRIAAAVVPKIAKSRINAIDHNFEFGLGLSYILVNIHGNNAANVLGNANKRLIPVDLEPWGTFSATYFVPAAAEKYRLATKRKYNAIVSHNGKVDDPKKIIRSNTADPLNEISIVRLVVYLSLNNPPRSAVNPPITKIKDNTQPAVLRSKL